MFVQKIKNGVAVEIEDFDMTDATLSEIETIKELVKKDVLVVIKKQSSAPGHFAKFISRIGKISNFKQFNFDPLTGEEIYDKDYWNDRNFINPDDWDDPNTYPVQRVTGKKLNGKRTGIFGSGVLDWHANLNGLTMSDGVALQGYKNCSNTSTTFLNTAVAYDNMPEDLKQRCQDVYCEYIYSPEVWAGGLPQDQFKRMVTSNKNIGSYNMWLIQRNIVGRTGIYFYTNNKCKIKTLDKTLFDDLYDYIFQEKFMYQNWYEPGDIILSDQLLSLHKRDQNDPDIISKRVLHRITFYVSNENGFVLQQNKDIN